MTKNRNFKNNDKLTRPTVKPGVEMMVFKFFLFLWFKKQKRQKFKFLFLMVFGY